MKSWSQWGLTRFVRSECLPNAKHDFLRIVHFKVVKGFQFDLPKSEQTPVRSFAASGSTGQLNGFNVVLHNDDVHTYEEVHSYVGLALQTTQTWPCYTISSIQTTHYQTRSHAHADLAGAKRASEHRDFGRQGAAPHPARREAVKRRSFAALPRSSQVGVPNYSKTRALLPAPWVDGFPLQLD